MNNKKILLVDDEVDFVYLLKMSLKVSGYDVLAAYDGEEAIQKAKTETPDLILLDILLPKINGYQAARILKSDPSSSKIPIIFLTAHGQPDNILAAEKAGADACIVKPFETEELLAKIAKMLA